MESSEIAEHKLKKLKYILMPGKTGMGYEFGAYHDSAYQYWKELWTKVYSDAGSLDAFVLDDFMRQDYISALFHGEQVVGLLFHTFFPLERMSTRDHRYFAFYPDSFRDKLRARGARLVQSFEFLSIDPLWTKHHVGVPLAEVIIGCGLKLMQQSSAQVAVASARRDVKVNVMGHRWGWKSLEVDVRKRNFPCDLVACFKEDMRLHPSKDVAGLVEYFWSHRLDTTQAEALSRAA